MGGVLEHPEGSHAWRAFGIPSPPRSGGWAADGLGGWTCCVAQGYFGHRARKLTWLYLFGVQEPPTLRWGGPTGMARLEDGFHSTEERRRLTKMGVCQRLSHRQRLSTPPAFRDLLLGLARMVEAAR